MTWARFDDGYDDNPKCRAAGRDGRALDQVGIRHCARNLTDGVIADHDLPVLAAKAEVRLKPTLRKLVETGRWHGPGHDCPHDCPPCPEGHHVVHDYLSFNPTGEKERAKRLARAEAGRKGGQRSRPPSNPEANSEAIASPNDEANAEQNRNPVPVTPGTYILPPTNGCTRPEPDGGGLIEQAVAMAATRYARHQVEQGKGSSEQGLASWWLQENADGARLRARRLLDDFDLTATQLADALGSASPRWLEAYRRRDVMHDLAHADPPDQTELAAVADIAAGVRQRLAHPRQETA